MQDSIIVLPLSQVQLETIIADSIKKSSALIKTPSFIPPDKDKKLSIKEACNYCGFSPPTLRKYCNSNLIRIRVFSNKNKFFWQSELEEDLKNFSLLKNSK